MKKKTLEALNNKELMKAFEIAMLYEWIKVGDIIIIEYTFEDGKKRPLVTRIKDKFPGTTCSGKDQVRIEVANSFPHSRHSWQYRAVEWVMIHSSYVKFKTPTRHQRFRYYMEGPYVDEVC